MICRVHKFAMGPDETDEYYYQAECADCDATLRREGPNTHVGLQEFVDKLRKRGWKVFNLNYCKCTSCAGILASGLKPKRAAKPDPEPIEV